MKAQDKVRLEAFRNIKKVILEAKTKPGAGDGIDDAECLKIIQKLANRVRSRQLFTRSRDGWTCMRKKTDSYRC